MPPSSKLLRSQIINDARAGAPAEPRCRHAPPNDLCGGCLFQDRAYPAQIAAKRAALQRIWEGLLTPEHCAALEIVPSPNPFEYRTRMDYVTSKGRLGLRRSGKFNYIIDLSECHLIPPAAFAVVRRVYERAMALGLPDYDLRSHEGFLRYLTVRRSPDSELLLAATTATVRHADAMDALAAFALTQPGVVGFHWLHNPGLADVAFGAPVRHWGRATLAMRIGQQTLEIGPNTFFQNNIHLTERLVADAAREGLAVGHQGPGGQAAGRPGTQEASLRSPNSERRSPIPSLADLYGGVGTIALRLAESGGRVVCVESVAESAALARANVARNGAAAVEVVEADVAAFLAAQPAGAFPAVVADPPRAGLGPAVCAELRRIAPRRIVYVSCNPLTQAEDARGLAPDYRIAALRGYDMFPQTAHLEAMAVFERQ
jgi:tRNA/tmRNA/rRNA uracil-C5-methylase (TrmA/RlmC/RlmD family)